MKAEARPQRDVPVDATVVSVVIRDFIYLTERLSPDSVADLMRDFYDRVSIQVSQQQGLLTSISNHSMVVTFAAVEGGDIHARRALRCALAIAMIAYQTRFLIRKTLSEPGLDKFGVGIGIHSGELMLAEFGRAPHAQKVATGHAVSIASLLSVKSKDLDWNVVCSEQVLNVVGDGVQTRRKAVVGADWLRHPVHVEEAVVVGDGETSVPEVTAGQAMDTTLALEGDENSGLPAFSGPKGGAPLSTPEIPGYRCLRLIGRGGMSRVFVAERLRDQRLVALKFADGSVSQDSEVLYRFVEEYGLLEQVHHPNLLHIFEQGVTDDALFIVMEYLPGGTLKQYIGSKGLEMRRAWRVLREMMLALVEVHRMGIIHRDIKPENIMLRSDGAAVLGDFGVARRMCKVRHGEQMAHIVGTPYFMSPEQALGEEEDVRADVYSMGAVLFNMLTGEKPYQGDTLEEIVRKHLQAPIPMLPKPYTSLQPLLDGMMSKDRGCRYSASDVLSHMAILEVDARTALANSDR